MKYLLNGCILAIIFCASCSKDEMPLNDVTKDTREVAILLTGDYLDIYSSPLTKGEASNAYYAFEVDSIHVVEYHEQGYTFIDTTYCHYAEGVFDILTKENLKITLQNGHKYRIRCSIVVNGEESLFVNNDCIQEPFASSVYGYGDKCKITNAFSYAETKTVYAYNTMNVVRIEGGNASGNNKWHAMVDRYYGEAETDGITPISINLTRRNFGLNFHLVPPKSGILKVYQDYGTPKFDYTLTTGDSIVDQEHIYSLDLVNDFTTIHLKIKWTSEDGETYDLSPEKFKVYNKTMTNISVDINNRIAQGGTSESAFGLVWDNGQLEEYDLTIK